MAIKWDKLTVKSQEAIQAAGQHAVENGNPEILPLHLMTALLEDREGIVLPVLEKIGVPTQQLLSNVAQAIERLPKIQGAQQQPSMGTALNKVLEQAFKEASNFKDEYVSTEHLLLALAQQRNEPVQLALAAVGATHDAILRALTSVRGTQRVTDQNPENKFQALEKYAKDVTDQARSGKLDPVIGRDEEIRRTIRILSRKTKNNPVLIGEPGVGKTAVVEGLARLIELEPQKVPARLRNSHVVQLQMGGIVAGTMLRGMFEERIKGIIDEVKERDNLILFIDEAHTIIGAGAALGTSSDAANMFKSALAKGELRILGATTLTEYKEYIAEDEALARQTGSAVSRGGGNVRDVLEAATGESFAAPVETLPKTICSAARPARATTIRSWIRSASSSNLSVRPMYTKPPALPRGRTVA